MALMARVDPDDDTVRRHVVRLYAYDRLRHERRHIVVAAYDDDAEYRAHLDRLHQELVGRRERGQVDPREHVSGTTLEPGHATAQAAARLVRRAMRHGAHPPADLIARASGATGFSFAQAVRSEPEVD
jgi:hypothetical protein